MLDLRKKARGLLDKVPGEVRSDAPGDEKKLFEELANGKTHRSLQEEWESTKHLTGVLRTVCIDFVVWYSGQMGINLYSTIDPKALNLKVDGFFNLQETLKKAGKSHAWVPATSQKLPQCGDILRHTAWHVDVAVGMDKGILERVAGGQSRHIRPTEDVTKEYDNIMRVRGKKEYEPKDLQGWLDIELFAQSPPGPTPPWVIGWWKVKWRNEFYYYYLAADGSARWTRMPPQPGPPPPLPPSASNRGSFIFNNPNGVSIRWYDSESKEDFERQPGSESTDMSGTWNGIEPIEATKI
ncbi:hypothetical protein [Schlesneria paludicola]|uniref:hypothetical protein n=1 Tax=Schlesneria paludicola TaxID=360056 RepID=UPI00029AA4E9|nr:hypothetical protein [Schlesneria paludicola]